MSIWPAAYEKHEPEILAYLRRRLRTREDAEDLCQETFTRAMQAEGALRNETALRPYLYRIASNLLINHVRRQGRVRTESEFAAGTDLATRADHRALNPEEHALGGDLKRRVEELMTRLPKDHRIAFELGVLQKRPYAEIGAELGWSHSKVKIAVFRARKQLIEGLGDYLPQGPEAQRS